MTAYRWGTTTSLCLDEIDVGFRRYRLQERDAEQAMAQSLRRYPPWSSSTRCLSTKPRSGGNGVFNGGSTRPSSGTLARWKTLTGPSTHRRSTVRGSRNWRRASSCGGREPR